ncbi:hypothetical protein BO82DRAFT_170432 [Aspergillus uvarum CBS 121591]|uniref:Uncharacterized protein n=1 Tax=Aspergillus uvarum CBS 121591 TaxID=1448315 RepID=A0A319CGY4_9EURO|nr:hypothetical protein BO82DRAFT_170432 [Aspergillus uvarum CBS 121591]PYH77873.1 hypothetical protein BO82DRAFT_170432 [Aspergillus uvarum CBS 121591]
MYGNVRQVQYVQSVTTSRLKCSYRVVRLVTDRRTLLSPLSLLLSSLTHSLTLSLARPLSQAAPPRGRSAANKIEQRLNRSSTDSIACQSINQSTHFMSWEPHKQTGT